MLVRVLGEVSLVDAEGRGVALPGTRQPALLAALAARAGEVVSVDRLVDLLWDDAAPDNPDAALHSAVFKLRASTARVTTRELVVTRERGYCLDALPGEIDAHVFASLVQRARDEPPHDAAETLTRAVGMWHGQAYAGFADTEIARLEAFRLEELHRVAVERCGEALLLAGRATEVITLLQSFVAEHPLRESSRITLMRALHAEGRTAEALDHYQAHRHELAEELGLEPSPALQEAQVAVLRSPSASRATSTEADPPSAVPAPVRRGLPGIQVKYLRTDAGQVIAYGSTGTGPPLVVLLGWVSSLDVIASGRDPRSSLLERLAGRATLTLYDRAGTGLSPGPVADYGLESSVDELVDVVRAVGAPVSLLAMSSAGPVALSLAHRLPSMVSSLVLFGTFANGPATFTDERLREMVVEMAASHWGVGSKMLADLYRPGISDEAAWHLAKVFRDSATPEVAAAYLQSMYDQDVSALLPSIRTPALVLHYRSDRLIWSRGGQDLAAGLPNATFLSLDGRVHLPDAADLTTIEEAIVDHVERYG
jgi:DNA-binding SARP family transcriptional activator/pimeloyl-ACP methyl ester carboxylesterase